MREAVLRRGAPTRSVKLPAALALAVAAAVVAWLASPSRPPPLARTFAVVLAMPSTPPPAHAPVPPEVSSAAATAVGNVLPAVAPPARTISRADGVVSVAAPPTIVHTYRAGGYRVDVEDASGWIRVGRSHVVVASDRGEIAVIGAGTSSRVGPGRSKTFRRTAPRGSQPDATPLWKSAAAAGQYKRALDAAVDGGFDALTRRLGAADLKRLADVARYAKDRKRARDALNALRARHPETKQARLAAFLLGKLASARRQDRRKAEAWFRTYLDESPRGQMVAECRGRIMELRNLRGDTASAAAAAKDYLAHHPSGSYADLAHAILAR